MAEERIAWLDIARTIAITLIVGFHVLYEFTLDESLRIIGYIGVSLFFIVSGFILARKYPNLKSFDIGWFKKRYIRIASLYYPTLMAIALLFFPDTYYKRLYDLILHFVFLNFISSDTLYSIISPAWFVIPLVALYILFPYLNRLLAWSKYALIAIFLLSFAERYATHALVSVSPLLFLGDFCFGIVFAQDRRNKVLLAPLIMTINGPLMIASYVIFYLLSLLEDLNFALPRFLAGTFSFIGKYTFELFLFHESLMKVALGKWHVYGLSTSLSLVVLVLTLLVVEWISRTTQNALLSNGSNKSR